MYSLTRYITVFILALLLGLPQLQAQTKMAQPSMAESCAKNQTLNQLILKADLTPLLSGSGPYTFFIPSDQALQQWHEDNPEVLKHVLLNHLVSGRYTAADLTEGAKLSTLGGGTITVLRKKNQIMINGTPITSSDVVVNNGVMHTINTVILPPR